MAPPMRAAAGPMTSPSRATSRFAARSSTASDPCGFVWGALVHRRFPALHRRRLKQFADEAAMRMAWPAALVHLFTALGAVCALLATRAALSAAWEQVFGWLGIALIIDGIDGTFARMADVKTRLPRFCGD